jgi:hypothetical protein
MEVEAGINNNPTKIGLMIMVIMLYYIVLISMMNRYKLVRAPMMISFIFHHLGLVLIIGMFREISLALK